ncbi:TPA: glycine C-acetyltransferase [Candidatus Acetothermia bacterium]|nr:glycine C-acetyltransferase [Candidatus Acetothermia bacterium]HAZ31010.1 glycine C-acetyltransferase [Candidatus Acetothermia bacterium]
MGKYDFITAELAELKAQGLYNTIRTIGSSVGAWTVVDGERVLNMCSNNYLGFADDPRLREAAQTALDEFGVGPAAVRSIAGTMTLHVEFERKLAAFKGVEDAISLQSGFCSNLAAIPTLVGAGHVLFTDELNHASIIDGCRLTKAERVIYPHRDVDALRKALAERKDAPRKMVVTDGVFSMDGDLAPLPGIVEAAEEFGALVMVDDAHGEGVLGSHGRGIVDHFGVQGRVDLEMGTLSKAFGVMGGYLAGKREIVEYLRQRARPFLFSSAATPADVAACAAAVEILEKSDEPVRRLWDNARYLKAKMVELGFNIGNSETPITPVMLGEATTAWEFSKQMFAEEVFAQAIVFPTVPRGKARIRVMVSAVHTREDLDFALAKFARVGRKLKVV